VAITLNLTRIGRALSDARSMHLMHIDGGRAFRPTRRRHPDVEGQGTYRWHAIRSSKSRRCLERHLSL